MGRTAMGVRSINLAEDDAVVDMVKVVKGGNVLTVTELGMGKRTPEDQYPVHHRGGKGVLATQLTEKTGDLACLKMTAEGEDVMLIRDDGTIIRLPLDQVNVISRNTQGVRLMRVDEGTRVVSVEIVPHSDEAEDVPQESITSEESEPERRHPRLRELGGNLDRAEQQHGQRDPRISPEALWRSSAHSTGGGYAPPFSSERVTGAGVAPQISSAYWRMVRSLENGPIRATLSAADRVQDGIS